MRITIPRVLLVLLLAGHCGWLLAHFEPAYSSPDASGYFVQARLLATEGTTAFTVSSPIEYLGVPWLETASGDFHSRYPPGLPLLLAPVHFLLGPTAALLVIPLLGTLALLFLFLLARLVTDEKYALAAAVLLAVVPIANRQALHADAHTAATCCLVAGLWLLVRWAGRPSLGRALAAGLVLGLLPAIRYPEGLAGLGVALFLVGHALRDRRRWPHLAAALAGALPAVVLLGAYNHAVFGSAFATGYGLTNEQTAFSFEPLREHLGPYLRALALESLGLFLPLGILGMLCMLGSRGRALLGAALLAIVLPLSTLYLAYYWGTAGDSTTRFFLPTMPLYFLAAVWLAHRLEQRLAARRAVYLALVAVVLAHAVLGIRGSALRMAREQVGTARGASVHAWLEENVEPGSVIIANRAVQGSLEYFGKYRLVDDQLVPGGPRRALVKTQNPNLRFLPGATDGRGPSPHQHDRGARLRREYENRSQPERARLVVRDLRAWAGEADIYWLCLPEEIRRFEGILGEIGHFESLLVKVPMATPTSRVCALFGDDPLEAKLPYWVAEEPLVVFRWRR